MKEARKDINVLDVLSRSAVIKRACMQALSTESKYSLSTTFPQLALRLDIKSLVPEIKHAIGEHRTQTKLLVFGDEVETVIDVLTTAQEMMKTKFELKTPFLPTIADLANLREIRLDIEAYGDSVKDTDDLEESLEKIIEFHGENGQWVERYIGALLSVANGTPHCTFRYYREEIGKATFYCTHCDSMAPFKFPAILEHRCASHTVVPTSGTLKLGLVDALDTKVGLAWNAKNFICGSYPLTQAFECTVCSGDAVDASRQSFVHESRYVSAFFTSSFCPLADVGF